MRRFAFLLAVAVVLIAMFGSGSQAIIRNPLRPQRSIVLEASGEFANGLGINPASRDANAFYREVSAGAPTGRVTGAHGTMGALGAALRGSGIAIALCGPEAGLIIDGQTQTSCDRSDAKELIVSVQRTTSVRAQPDLLIRSSGGRTPMLISLAGAQGFIDGSITHRPGIVTPYDISATILKLVGVQKPPGFIGTPLHAGSFHGSIDALSQRFIRDSHYQQSLTAWTVIVGLALGCFLAFILWFLGLRSFARRISTGAGFASAGYLIGLFIPSSRGDVRALFVFAFLILGILFKPSDSIRLLAKVFIVVGAATTLLEIASALHPQGEPALSFWGNPLISWRFYGLLNYEVAFIAGGALVAVIFLWQRAFVLASVVTVALIITGAPELGANFVGVLTLGFGGAFAVISSLRKDLKLSTIIYSALIAGVLFAAALAVGSAVGGSHGARAANEISSGGAPALWTLTWSRLRLNVEAIRAFPGGVFYAAIFLIQFIVMVRWSIKNESESLGLRIAIASCSLAGLAALLLEDSGFKMSAVQGFPALILWTLVMMKPDVQELAA